MTKKQLVMASLMTLSVFPAACFAPNQMTTVGGNPIQMMKVGNEGANITIGLAKKNAFATKGTAAGIEANVDYYQIQLVADAGVGVPYDAAGPWSGVTYIMTGAHAGAVGGGFTLPNGLADDANNRMQFVGVPAGSYRARARAWVDGGNLTFDNGAADDVPLSVSNPGVNTDPNWAVSTNKADVSQPVFGSPTVNYNGPAQLDVPVQLKDAVLDNVITQLNVTPGNATPVTAGAADVP